MPMFTHHALKSKPRVDDEIDANLGQLQKRLMHQHLSNLHKKLRTPPAGGGGTHEDMGETPAEEVSEHEQQDGMPGEGHVAPERHGDILKQMLDSGEGEHEEQKAHEMERQESPNESQVNPGRQHEPVMEEEHDSEPAHMKAKHKKFRGI